MTKSWAIFEAKVVVYVGTKWAALVNWVNGLVMKAYSLTNTLHYPSSPKNPHTSKTLWGIGQLTMASTLFGSREVPSFETINPR